MFKRFALPLVLVASAFVAGPAASATGIKDDHGCTGPFIVYEGQSGHLCDLLPFLCDSTPPVFGDLGGALIATGRITQRVKSGAITPAAGKVQIRAVGQSVLVGLGVAPAVRSQALSQIDAANSTNLGKVAANTMSVGAAMAANSTLLIAAIGTSDAGDDYAQSSGATVTTTTNAGWEIDLGIFKIVQKPTVTTVETTEESPDDDYTDVCDPDGVCACVAR